jgi:hypothetical protein
LTEKEYNAVVKLVRALSKDIHKAGGYKSMSAETEAELKRLCDLKEAYENEHWPEMEPCPYCGVDVPPESPSAWCSTCVAKFTGHWVH